MNAAFPRNVSKIECYFYVKGTENTLKYRICALETPNDIKKCPYTYQHSAYGVFLPQI